METWTVGAPVGGETGGVWRVAASVAGHEVWFESPDARLEPSAEAFAGAFLVQALHRDARLVVECPLDAVWLANTEKLLPPLHRWWGYPERHPVDATGEIRPPARPGRPQGLFFSGGADSLHSLLRLDDGFEALVFVQGFDIDLHAVARMDAWEKSFREIARRTGKRAILVRTNLREHPLHEPPIFGRTHGGALAAVAHVLSAELGSVLVSSSYRYDRDQPWGSRWDLDPLWASSSSSLRHGDASLGHHQKVVEIAHEPLVAEGLRVCFERTGAPGNCSRCEKCVRTMVSLEVAGALRGSAAFDASMPLAARVDAIAAVKPALQAVWEEYLDEPLSAQTRAAVRRLLRRSRRHHARRRLVRRIGRRLRRLSQWAPGPRRPER